MDETKKYLDDERTQELIDKTKDRLNKKENLVFKGTSDEWDALTDDEKTVYSMRCFTDGSGGEIVDNYSTAETKTNKVWIDGKPIYRKVVTGLRYGDAVTDWTDTGARILNCGTLVSAVGLRINTNGVFHFNFQMDGNNVNYIQNESDFTTLNAIIVEYTKTTD